MRCIPLVMCCVVLSACAPPTHTTMTPTTFGFLTRADCVNTDTMRARLDEALESLGRPATYAVIDGDALPQTDARRGYGTPTVFVDDRDLFGMPQRTTAGSPT